MTVESQRGLIFLFFFFFCPLLQSSCSVKTGFRRPRQKNEPVVWYSSSSVLLCDPAGSGLCSPRQRRMCVYMCVRVSVCPWLHNSHPRIWNAMNPFLLKSPTGSDRHIACPVAWFVFWWRVWRKTEHNADAWSLRRANIATATEETKTNTESDTAQGENISRGMTNSRDVLVGTVGFHFCPCKFVCSGLLKPLSEGWERTAGSWLSGVTTDSRQRGLLTG